MLKIRFTTRFSKELKNLKKKYKKIENDLEPLISNLTKGKIFGDRLQDFKGYEIYKIRIKNSSSGFGKSGGFRSVICIKRKDELLIMISIYSKTEKENISKNEILEIIKQENI